MNNIIQYRRPDDESYALVNSNGPRFFSGSDTGAALSLPPLEAGRDAFPSLNFIRPWKKLESKDHIFCTSCDTGNLLHTYCE